MSRKPQEGYNVYVCDSCGKSTCFYSRDVLSSSSSTCTECFAFLDKVHVLLPIDIKEMYNHINKNKEDDGKPR